MCRALRNSELCPETIRSHHIAPCQLKDGPSPCSRLSERSRCGGHPVPQPRFFAFPVNKQKNRLCLLTSKVCTAILKQPHSLKTLANTHTSATLLRSWLTSSVMALASCNGHSDSVPHHLLEAQSERPLIVFSTSDHGHPKYTPWTTSFCRLRNLLPFAPMFELDRMSLVAVLE